MSHFSQIAFTDAVKKVQSLVGTRSAMENLSQHADQQDGLSDDLKTFIRNRNSALIATANAAGQPHLQHRGGNAGFIRVVNDTTLMLGEEPGNGQFITQGNLDENPKAMLLLIDFTTRRHVKVWGEAFVSFDDNLSTLMDGYAPASPAPVIVFKITAWEDNTHKSMPKLYGEDAVHSLEARITDLEASIGTFSMAALG